MSKFTEQELEAINIMQQTVMDSAVRVVAQLRGRLRREYRNRYLREIAWRSYSAMRKTPAARALAMDLENPDRNPPFAPALRLLAALDGGQKLKPRQLIHVLDEDPRWPRVGE